MWQSLETKCNVSVSLLFNFHFISFIITSAAFLWFKSQKTWLNLVTEMCITCTACGIFWVYLCPVFWFPLNLFKNLKDCYCSSIVEIFVCWTLPLHVFHHYNQPTFKQISNLQNTQSRCSPYAVIVNYKHSKTPWRKPAGRHHAYTHPGEWIKCEERELDVMPDVEQVGKRWENAAFFSIPATRFSSVRPNIRTLCQFLT